MENSIENMHTDVGALRVNKRKKKQTDSCCVVEIKTLEQVDAMTNWKY